MSATQVALAALDGGGKAVTLRADQNPDNSIAMRASLEIGGVAVGAGNAVPVADATLSAAAGAPADAAWSGTGSATIIAALKALWTALTGTLTATLSGALPAGTNALGTVGVTALPTLPAGSNTIGSLAPLAATSTQTGGTIAAGNTFQSVLAAGARKGATIMNTSAHTMYVFFGPTGNATLINSFQVPPGATISALQGGIVLTDNIAVTTSTTGDTWVLNVQ